MTHATEAALRAVQSWIASDDNPFEVDSNLTESEIMECLREFDRYKKTVTVEEVVRALIGRPHHRRVVLWYGGSMDDEHPTSCTDRGTNCVSCGCCEHCYHPCRCQSCGCREKIDWLSEPHLAVIEEEPIDAQ